MKKEGVDVHECVHLMLRVDSVVRCCSFRHQEPCTPRDLASSKTCTYATSHAGASQSSSCDCSPQWDARVCTSVTHTQLPPAAPMLTRTTRRVRRSAAQRPRSAAERGRCPKNTLFDKNVGKKRFVIPGQLRLRLCTKQTHKHIGCFSSFQAIWVGNCL